MNLSLLIHTFSGYSFLWPGLIKSMDTNWHSRPPIFFGSDIPCENDATVYNSKQRTVLYSGPGLWSDRLLRLLPQIHSDYILYMQEDHWPTMPPPDLNRMMDIVKEHDLVRLQLSTINHFYSLTQHNDIHFFNLDSKYLVSHQPSIWKKSFLKECLSPGENPWQNEYEGTKRLNNREDLERKIAIYPCNWYAHKCIKGRLIES